jgi:hypothetical protein
MIKQVREEKRDDWDTSRKLITSGCLPQTLRLLHTQVRGSTFSMDLQNAVLACLDHQQQIDKAAHLDATRLKALTGLPSSKALRALTVVFGLTRSEHDVPVDAELPVSRIQQILTESVNPYDVLLQTENPSLLDLGAGDLSFEQELTDHLLPQLQGNQNPLILHAVDRLQPGSRFGGVYHANQARQSALKTHPSDVLQFRFWGGVNMMDVLSLKGRRSSYSLVTCHAPASPTFAFEPTRLSPETISRALRQSKGEFQVKKIDGESALEVVHGKRVLTFPSWKFEVCGPLALFDLMSRLGHVCILSSIDAEVFWEMLAQLLADERFRPVDTLFDTHNLPEIFGSLYSQLMALQEGERMLLSDFADLRTSIPRVISPIPTTHPTYHFPWVEIRRGAMLQGVPSSFTAHQFAHMSEEILPWWLILIPSQSSLPSP